MPSNHTLHTILHLRKRFSKTGYMPLRCFQRRYRKHCTKGMRTVLYNMLGCESFISRSFRPFPRGGEQKIMIVSGVLNSGCERSAVWYGKRGGNGRATGPAFLRKKLQKSRETYGFTAFSGGPDRIRTDDPHNANVMRSQLRYRPIFGCFVYFRSVCLCSLLFWPGPCYVALALPTELWAHISVTVDCQASYRTKYMMV